VSLICSYCSNVIGNVSQRWQLRDKRKGLQGSWQLVECDTCGVISIMPMPTYEQLATYYDAYSKDDKVDLSLRHGSSFPKLRKLFHCLTGDVDPRDFVKVLDGMRVLDYGCGHAGYLSDFHSNGVAISGAEIDSDVVEVCQKNGFDVHKVDNYSCIPFDNEEFDIVYLMQVFEHLREPRVFMKELSRVLKNGGELYLSVPNSSSIWRRIFGKHWVSGWFTPFHLYHYNRKSLTELASQYDFEVLNYWSSTPVSWFMLNIKALFFHNDNELDRNKSIFDARWFCFPIMLLLRIIEIPFPDRDCIVMHFKKGVS